MILVNSLYSSFILVYNSNRSNVLLVCLFWNACCGSCRSSSDDEENFGNPDAYEEQQDQQ
jgi:hypothetical protein